MAVGKGKTIGQGKKTGSGSHNGSGRKRTSGKKNSEIEINNLDLESIGIVSKDELRNMPEYTSDGHLKGNAPVEAIAGVGKSKAKKLHEQGLNDVEAIEKYKKNNSIKTGKWYETDSGARFVVSKHSAQKLTSEDQENLSRVINAIDEAFKELNDIQKRVDKIKTKSQAERRIKELDKQKKNTTKRGLSNHRSKYSGGTFKDPAIGIERELLFEKFPDVADEFNHHIYRRQKDYIGYRTTADLSSMPKAHEKDKMAKIFDEYVQSEESKENLSEMESLLVDEELQEEYPDLAMNLFEKGDIEVSNVFGTHYTDADSKKFMKELKRAFYDSKQLGGENGVVQIPILAQTMHEETGMPIQEIYSNIYREYLEENIHLQIGNIEGKQLKADDGVRFSYVQLIK